jgi:ABC-type multidrug transport system ATPase subunit
MRRLPGPIVQVRALERGYGPRAALAGVDLAVRAGEIHGLLGSGGSGKTTLLRVLAGLLPPTAGEVRVQGRAALVSVQETSAFQGVSAVENLTFAGRLHGLTQLESVKRARTRLDEAGLGAAGARAVGDYTPAQLQRLAFARALMTSPAVLLVEERSEGLDAATTAAVRGLAATHALRGGSVVWASRRLDELHGFAGDVTLIAAGRVRYAGSVDALMLRSWAGAARPYAVRAA